MKKNIFYMQRRFVLVCAASLLLLALVVGSAASLIVSQPRSNVSNQTGLKYAPGSGSNASYCPFCSAAD
jgi:hypothetical protein